VIRENACLALMEIGPGRRQQCPPDGAPQGQGRRCRRTLHHCHGPVTDLAGGGARAVRPSRTRTNPVRASAVSALGQLGRGAEDDRARLARLPHDFLRACVPRLWRRWASWDPAAEAAVPKLMELVKVKGKASTVRGRRWRWTDRRPVRPRQPVPLLIDALKDGTRRRARGGGAWRCWGRRQGGETGPDRRPQGPSSRRFRGAGRAVALRLDRGRRQSCGAGAADRRLRDGESPVCRGCVFASGSGRPRARADNMRSRQGRGVANTPPRPCACPDGRAQTVVPGPGGARRAGSGVRFWILLGAEQD